MPFITFIILLFISLFHLLATFLFWRENDFSEANKSFSFVKQAVQSPRPPQSYPTLASVCCIELIRGDPGWLNGWRHFTSYCNQSNS